MVASSHPLVGLPHKCDVVRKIPVDDGAGGIAEGASETVVYLKRTCRVASLDPNDIELKDYGFDPKRHKKVVMVYSPKVLRVDFLKVPWGVPPNVVVPLGLNDKFAPAYVLRISEGSSAPVDVTLTWDGVEYNDGEDAYRVFWTGTVWGFEDAGAGFVYHFDGFRQSQNIFKRPWDEEVGAEYEIVGVSPQTAMMYRIVWVKHQIDEAGRTHHTSLVIQLEEPDT